MQYTQQLNKKEHKKASQIRQYLEAVPIRTDLIELKHIISLCVYLTT